MIRNNDKLANDEFAFENAKNKHMVVYHNDFNKISTTGWSSVEKHLHVTILSKLRDKKLALACRGLSKKKLLHWLLHCMGMN